MSKKDDIEVHEGQVQIINKVEPYLYRRADDGYLYFDFTHCVMRVKESELDKDKPTRNAKIVKLIELLAMELSIKVLTVAKTLDPRETLVINEEPDRH